MRDEEVVVHLRGAVVVLVALLLFGAACGSDAGSSAADTTSGPATSGAGTSGADTSGAVVSGAHTTAATSTTEAIEPPVSATFSVTLSGWGGPGVSQVQDGSESIRDDDGNCSGYFRDADGDRQEMATASIKEGATVIVFDADGTTELGRGTLSAGRATINERSGEFWRCDFTFDTELPARDSYRLKIGSQTALRQATLVDGVFWVPLLRTRPRQCTEPSNEAYEPVAGEFVTRASRDLCDSGVAATYRAVCTGRDVAPGVVVRVRAGDRVVEDIEQPPGADLPEAGDQLVVEYASGAPCR
jgi:hypothetical protein